MSTLSRRSPGESRSDMTVVLASPQLALARHPLRMGHRERALLRGQGPWRGRGPRAGRRLLAAAAARGRAGDLVGLVAGLADVGTAGGDECVVGPGRA